MDWDDADSWDRMRRGVACPMCSDISLSTNEFSILVAELRQSYVRLARNQYRRGYTVVALKRHAHELFELRTVELAGYWQDEADAAAALHDVFEPVKLTTPCWEISVRTSTAV
jgi:diadenosine tetraphosphate (Ap4A) HIT family hydrolase